MNKQYEYEGKKYILLVNEGDRQETCNRCAFGADEDGTMCQLAVDDCTSIAAGYMVLNEQVEEHLLGALSKQEGGSHSIILPTDSKERKSIPITSGVLDYFPLAIAEVAKASYAGNQQHHADRELFWDKTKSTDHSDCISRHLIDRGKYDSDGIRHSAKLAWRALALLQIELENEKERP